MLGYKGEEITDQYGQQSDNQRQQQRADNLSRNSRSIRERALESPQFVPSPAELGRTFAKVRSSDNPAKSSNGKKAEVPPILQQPSDEEATEDEPRQTITPLGSPSDLAESLASTSEDEVLTPPPASHPPTSRGATDAELSEDDDLHTLQFAVGTDAELLDNDLHTLASTASDEFSLVPDLTSPATEDDVLSENPYEGLTRTVAVSTDELVRRFKPLSAEARTVFVRRLSSQVLQRVNLFVLFRRSYGHIFNNGTATFPNLSRLLTSEEIQPQHDHANSQTSEQLFYALLIELNNRDAEGDLDARAKLTQFILQCAKYFQKRENQLQARIFDHPLVIDLAAELRIAQHHFRESAESSLDKFHILLHRHANTRLNILLQKLADLHSHSDNNEIAVKLFNFCLTNDHSHPAMINVASDYVHPELTDAHLVMILTQANCRSTYNATDVAILFQLVHQQPHNAEWAISQIKKLTVGQLRELLVAIEDLQRDQQRQLMLRGVDMRCQPHQPTLTALHALVSALVDKPNFMRDHRAISDAALAGNPQAQYQLLRGHLLGYCEFNLSITMQLLHKVNKANDVEHLNSIYEIVCELDDLDYQVVRQACALYRIAKLVNACELKTGTFIKTTPKLVSELVALLGKFKATSMQYEQINELLRTVKTTISAAMTDAEFSKDDAVRDFNYLLLHVANLSLVALDSYEYTVEEMGSQEDAEFSDFMVFSPTRGGGKA